MTPRLFSVVVLPVYLRLMQVVYESWREANFSTSRQLLCFFTTHFATHLRTLPRATTDPAKIWLSLERHTSSPPDVLCNQSLLRYLLKSQQKAPTPNPPTLLPNMDFATMMQTSPCLQHPMLIQGRQHQSRLQPMQRLPRLSKTVSASQPRCPDD